MTKKQVESLVREGLTLAGGIAASYGFGNDEMISIYVGFGVQAAMLGWALATKQGLQMVGTTVRKALQAAVPIAVGFEFLTAGQAAAILQFVSFLLAAVWGVAATGDGAGRPPGMTLLLVFPLLMVGCGATFRTTEDGCLLFGKGYERNGRVEQAWVGACEDGRVILEWEQEDPNSPGHPVRLRGVKGHDGRWMIFWMSGDGWIEHSSKSGYAIRPPDV